MTSIAISAHSASSAPATYEAFQHSILSGAEYVELDIRKTRDSTLVAYHDARLMRDEVPVRNLAYRELCESVGFSVPRVDEVMRMMADKAIGHLDLKEPDYEDEVIKVASDELGEGNFIVTSLEDASIYRIKNSYPKVQAALSLGRDLADVPRSKRLTIRFRELRPLERIRSCGADWVAVNYKLALLGVLSQCARHGIGVMVWTVNSDRLIDRFLADSRVTVLVTDRPERALRSRAEHAVDV